MKRAFILMLDSFGIGELPDAKKFNDEGSHTLKHIAENCIAGKADVPNVRQGPLKLPNMAQLGLYAAANACQANEIFSSFPVDSIKGAYGFARELSFGKDTPSGHWEIAGVPVLFASLRR